MDRHKVRFDFFSKTIAITTARDERDIHMGVGMILFFLFGKKGQKNRSCLAIVKLLCDPRLIALVEEIINLRLGYVLTAAQLDEIHFLHFRSVTANQLTVPTRIATLLKSNPTDTTKSLVDNAIMTERLDSA